jgi:hypothetical protein
MRRQRKRWGTVGVLICSMALVPAYQAVAAGPRAGGPSDAAAGAVVRDLALQAGGVLRGQVLDKQGKACAGVAVALGKTGTTDAAPVVTRSDEQGRFQFQNLSGGVYHLGTTEGGTICRLWAPNTAPPSATPAALLVQGEGPVRANLGGLGPWGWALIGLGVAAAIAIPLALQKNDDEGS